jgi:hypothetical protein
MFDLAQGYVYCIGLFCFEMTNRYLIALLQEVTWPRRDRFPHTPSRLVDSGRRIACGYFGQVKNRLHKKKKAEPIDR